MSKNENTEECVKSQAPEEGAAKSTEPTEPTKPGEGAEAQVKESRGQAAEEVEGEPKPGSRRWFFTEAAANPGKEYAGPDLRTYRAVRNEDGLLVFQIEHLENEVWGDLTELDLSDIEAGDHMEAGWVELPAHRAKVTEDGRLEIQEPKEEEEEHVPDSPLDLRRILENASLRTRDDVLLHVLRGRDAVRKGIGYQASVRDGHTLYEIGANGMSLAVTMQDKPADDVTLREEIRAAEERIGAIAIAQAPMQARQELLEGSMQTRVSHFPEKDRKEVLGKVEKAKEGANPPKDFDPVLWFALIEHRDELRAISAQLEEMTSEAATLEKKVKRLTKAMTRPPAAVVIFHDTPLGLTWERQTD